MLTRQVQKESAGKRLDTVVLQMLPQYARSEVYKLMRLGKVKLNGKKAKPSAGVKEDDVLTFFVSPQGEKRLSERKKGVKVLFEDADLMVVNKPPFLASQPGTGVERNNLITQVKMYLQEKGWKKKVALAHRLDRGTSGCVIVAKHQDAIMKCYDLFKQGRVQKTYLALVGGRVKKEKGTLTGYLHRVKEQFQHKVVISEKRGSGVQVQMNYKVKQRFAQYTLLEVELLTGKMHQIRAQCAHAGFPVVGDPIYGDPEMNKVWREKAGLKRQFLHAGKVAFVHPYTKEKVMVEAPLPPDLKKVLARLS